MYEVGSRTNHKVKLISYSSDSTNFAQGFRVNLFYKKHFSWVKKLFNENQKLLPLSHISELSNFAKINLWKLLPRNTFHRPGEKFVRQVSKNSSSFVQFGLNQFRNIFWWSTFFYPKTLSTSWDIYSTHIKKIHHFHTSQTRPISRKEFCHNFCSSTVEHFGFDRFN